MVENETSSPTEAPVDAIESEASPTKENGQGRGHRMDRKTLFVFLGFFLALIVLVVLNMN
jgi:hypothetical protein